MFEPVRNAIKIPELRRKILYSLAMLVLFRVGSYVPVPGVDSAALARQLGVDRGNIFGFLDLFAGGALSRFSVFAMGVSPYITSSIILQLLTIVIPSWRNWRKRAAWKAGARSPTTPATARWCSASSKPLASLHAGPQLQRLGDRRGPSIWC